MTRKCPHCDHALTIQEAVVTLNGSGFKTAARVRLKNGDIALINDVSKINPNEVVEILEP